jgi:hypothetical protein
MSYLLTAFAGSGNRGRILCPVERRDIRQTGQTTSGGELLFGFGVLVAQAGERLTGSTAMRSFDSGRIPVPFFRGHEECPEESTKAPLGKQIANGLRSLSFFNRFISLHLVNGG